ncbi:hypothetical protein CDL15_Pgr024783 [Punica granatum]|uniref:Uncharacterized protein n=1 Tax=Punica granatum TaxID=22663 RepID=A0A218VU90_PUNGR|nr:hypothetical protein CDL15_Pgr024783 [Punica granatum]
MVSLLDMEARLAQSKGRLQKADQNFREMTQANKGFGVLHGEIGMTCIHMRMSYMGRLWEQFSSPAHVQAGQPSSSSVH